MVVHVVNCDFIWDLNINWAKRMYWQGVIIITCWGIACSEGCLCGVGCARLISCRRDLAMVLRTLPGVYVLDSNPRRAKILIENWIMKQQPSWYSFSVDRLKSIWLSVIYVRITNFPEENFTEKNKFREKINTWLRIEWQLMAHKFYRCWFKITSTQQPSRPAHPSQP